jgi:hypothetical protein
MVRPGHTSVFVCAARADTPATAIFDCKPVTLDLMATTGNDSTISKELGATGDAQMSSDGIFTGNSNGGKNKWTTGVG